jgi:hypothetical protein
MAEDVGYRKAVKIAGLEGFVRESPRSPIGRFGIIIGAGVTGRTALGNQLQCPILHMEAAGLLQFTVEFDDFVKAAIDAVPPLAQAKQVVLVGVSGSAQLVIMVGMALAKAIAPRSVRVIAFNPPTKIWPFESSRMNTELYRSVVALAERDPTVRKRLEDNGDLVPLLQAIPQQAPTADLKCMVFGSLRKERDAWHAERVAGLPGVHVELIDTDVHLLHRLMVLPLSTKEGTRADLARRWGRFDDPEGQRIALSEGELTQLVDIIFELRAKYPNLRAMVDALDRMTLDGTQNPPVESIAAS